MPVTPSQKELVDKLMELQHTEGINAFEVDFIASIRERVYRFNKAMTPKQIDTAENIFGQLSRLKHTNRRPRRD